MTTDISESELQTLVASHIEFLEPGLELLSKEKYIPNALGTRSFIDLYAKDRENHHVLIELKRSDSASREALHEIHKYVEGVKSRFGCKDGEIRVIVASTEWKELIVPFSRFVADSPISVTGINIKLSNGGSRFSAEKVVLVDKSKERAIAPWHDLNCYYDEASLDRGISEYKKYSLEKGIEDYFLVILDAPEGFHEAAVSAMRHTLTHISSNNPERIESMLSLYSPPKHILYHAMQLLTAGEYLYLLSDCVSREEYKEVQETISDMEDEEALRFLHESLSSVEPRPHYDDYEIGYPAKFKSKLLDDEGWSVREILRFGVFSRNELLSDSDIINELKGGDGGSGQSFKRKITVSNKSHISSAKKDIEECLSENPVWMAHVLRHLREIEENSKEAEADISIYNPCTGVLTLYFCLTRENGLLYIPQYSILVTEEGVPKTMYFGELTSTGKPESLKKILDKYYGGEMSMLLMSMTWGGRAPDDADIIEDLGLSYSSFRCDFSGEGRSFFTLKNERWRPIERHTPFESISKYFSKNERALKNIVGRIQSHQTPFGWQS